MQTVRLSIGGMTCVNCQDRIERKLKSLDGVADARVSYSRGTAQVTFDPGRVPVQALEGAVEGLGYRILRGGQPQGAAFGRTAGLLAGIVLLYAALQKTGLLNLLAPGQLADTGMGYGMLFAIGVATSLHCVAMCGGINLSQCLPRGPAGSGRAALRPALLYNLGRVASYTAMGLLLGAAGFLLGGGKQLGISTLLQGGLKMAAGAFMVAMGIGMLGLFPALRGVAPRLPRALAAAVGRQRAKSRQPFYVGLLNGLMPCGPLQSMWIVALATGSPAAGALSMLAFSLGTVPLMLGLGSLVSLLGKRFASQVRTVGAVLVTVLGLAMVAQGGALSGWLPPDRLLLAVVAAGVAGILLCLPVGGRAVRATLGAACACLAVGLLLAWGRQTTAGVAAAPAGAAQVQDGVQVVRSTLEAGKYPSITVQAGVPVRWIIDAPEGSVTGCNYRMLIRALDLEYTLSTGENVIEFTPQEAGTIRYSCWMGMIYGNIFVTDGTAEGAAVGDVAEPTPAGYAIPTGQLAVAVLQTDGQGRPLQQVSIRLTEDGFEPAVVVMQAGINARWDIEVDLPGGGGTDLVAPSYATVLQLAQGDNPLSLYPAADFDVATGDYRAFAYVKVVDDLAALDEAAIRAEVAAYDPLIYPADTYAGAGMGCCQ